jgi:hypothetical protein
MCMAATRRLGTPRWSRPNSAASPRSRYFISLSLSSGADSNGGLQALARVAHFARDGEYSLLSHHNIPFYVLIQPVPLLSLSLSLVC